MHGYDTKEDAEHAGRKLQATLAGYLPDAVLHVHHDWGAWFASVRTRYISVSINRHGCTPDTYTCLISDKPDRGGSGLAVWSTTSKDIDRTDVHAVIDAALREVHDYIQGLVDAHDAMRAEVQGVLQPPALHCSDRRKSGTHR